MSFGIVGSCVGSVVRFFYLVDSDFYHEEVYTELYDFSDWHPNETEEEFWDHEDVW